MFATAPTAISQDTLRYGGLDITRLVLACMVVLAHASFFMAIGPEANFFFNNGVARIIVPFFFVMSGYFFERQTRAGIWPWLRRLGGCYLVWMAVYFPTILIYNDFSVLRFGFYALFGYAHLWFLPALLGGGVMFHLLRNIGNGRLVALAVLLVGAGVGLQYLQDVTYDMDHLNHRVAHEALTRNFLFLGFPYVAIGAVIRRTGFAEGEWGARDWGLLGAGCIALAAETGFNSLYMPYGGIFEVMFSALLVTPVLFRFVTALPLRLQGRSLRDLSSAVYFSHMLFLIPLRDGFDLSPGRLTILALTLTFALAPVLLLINRRVALF